MYDSQPQHSTSKSEPINTNEKSWLTDKFNQLVRNYSCKQLFDMQSTKYDEVKPPTAATS